MSCEVIFHRGPQIAVGEVRCAADDPELAVLGPIHGWCVSFPRLPVALRTRGHSGMIADGSTALLLASGVVLDRKALSGNGSRCQWFALSDSLVDEARASSDRSRGDLFGPAASIGLGKSPALTLLEHQLFRRAAGASAVDADLSELACGVLDSILIARTLTLHTRADRTLADAARSILAIDPTRTPRSDALAARLGVSVFHLCRTFKRVTGQTIQEFSRRLRLDLALERLAEADIDLSALAFELGFSSHSHFTAAFRAVFGLSPSTYRERRRSRRSIA